MNDELRRRQLAFKKADKFLTHAEPEPIAMPPATPRRSPRNALPQFKRPNAPMFVQADAINEMLAHAMEAPKHWVPEKFMEERSKPEHIDQQEFCAGVTIGLRIDLTSLVCLCPSGIVWGLDRRSELLFGIFAARRT